MALIVEETLIQFFVLGVVSFLVYSLYKELFSPSFTFFISIVALLLVGVLTPEDILKGLANQQLVVIFLLILVTAGVRIIYGVNFFSVLFSNKLKPRAFLLRMMVVCSSVSAFLNNTPVVAFMIPFVKDWAEKTGNSGSKFLIPLSFATILGGMITVIGTSTNLILTGLLVEYDLPVFHFTDFLFLGVIVTVAGWIYLYFIGYKLLPAHDNKIEFLKGHLKEYIVELQLYGGSPLIGQTIKEAGLRKLQDIFLAEIIRKGKVISPVGPETILEERDALFFSGNTAAILKVIKEDNGLHLPANEVLPEGQFNFIEAVIPANSDLIGVRIKDSNFRKKFNASIIAIHRNGKRVSGSVGEMELSGGDFLLLLTNSAEAVKNYEKDLFVVSMPMDVPSSKPKSYKWVGLICFGLLIAGIVGILPLFTVCVLILVIFMLFGILKLEEIRKQLDLNLFMVLVCSLAVGVGLEKSGAAHLLADLLIKVGAVFGNTGVLTALFISTLLLTSLVTNPAAVAIMFPIALSIATDLELPSKPFFLAIAFAASGDFMTPIGYQTNLMVYGPGGYSFRDFLRVGGPFTLVYSILCLTFIMFYYNLLSF